MTHQGVLQRGADGSGLKEQEMGFSWCLQAGVSGELREESGGLSMGTGFKATRVF